MTPAEYERWKDFAVRMAKTVFRGYRRPGPRHILDCVQMWFCDIENDSGAYNKETVLEITSWEDGPDHALPCDVALDYEESWMPDYWFGDMESVAWERRRDRWCDPPRICIRAGLDMALGCGIGVYGYTAGDVRAMYPEGVPQWISKQWDNGTTIDIVGLMTGVGLVPEENGPCVPFDEMPDSAKIFL